MNKLLSQSKSILLILALTVIIKGIFSTQNYTYAGSLKEIKCNIGDIDFNRFASLKTEIKKSRTFHKKSGKEYVDIEPLMKNSEAFDQQALVDTIIKNPRRANPLPVNINFSRTAFLFQITSDKSARITLRPPKISSRKTHDMIIKQGKDGCYILIRLPDIGEWDLGIQSYGTVTVKAGNVADLFLGDISFKRVVFTPTGPTMTNALTRIDYKDFLEVKFTGTQRFATKGSKFTLRDKNGTILHELPSLYIGNRTFIMAPFESSSAERFLHVSSVDEFRRRITRKHHVPIDKITAKIPFRNIQEINPDTGNAVVNTVAKIMGETQIQAYERAWKAIISEGTYSNARLLELYKNYTLLK